jgi:hypothetical protein
MNSHEELTRIRKTLQNWGDTLVLISCIAAGIGLWLILQ